MYKAKADCCLNGGASIRCWYHSDGWVSDVVGLDLMQLRLPHDIARLVTKAYVCHGDSGKDKWIVAGLRALSCAVDGHGLNHAITEVLQCFAGA